MPDANMEDAG
jgi:U4/U6 small nuclear ribonucleoprotein PRP3